MLCEFGLVPSPATTCAILPCLSNNTVPLTEQPSEGETVVMYAGDNVTRRTVVKRDDDILTPGQLQLHRVEVQEAQL